RSRKPCAKEPPRAETTPRRSRRSTSCSRGSGWRSCWPIPSGASPPLPEPALPHRSGGLLDPRGLSLENPREHRNPLRGELPVLLLDRLPDGGKRLDAVARVEAGRIDFVLEPRPSRKTFAGEEQSLQPEELPVHGRRGSVGGCGIFSAGARQ